jgi:hypothetical protein
MPWQTTRGGKWISGKDEFYSADQLKQAIRDALEEAARVCESEWSNAAEKLYGIECAAAIRKLKEDIQ